MYKIAIDTNIWFNLIENLEIDLLDNLWHNLNNKRIQILLPISVEIEFNKKIDSIKNKTLKNNPNATQQDVDSLLQSVYSLFEKSLRLKTIEKGLANWVMSGKAPNHNGNNYEDTLILNTLLGLPKKAEFYFVANDSHFRISKQDFILHPDIIEKFSNNDIKINYSTDLSKLLFKIGNSGFINDELNNYELYNWKAFKLKVKNKCIFEQLKEAIDYYYKELDFIPFSFLSKIFPIKSHTKQATYAEFKSQMQLYG